MNQTQGAIEKIAKEVVDSEGLSLVEIRLCNHTNYNEIKVVVDKDTGVSLDECGRVNKQIRCRLENELAGNDCVIEVVSPGLDRPLKNKSDFSRVTGKLVKIMVKKPVDDKWEFVATVKEVREGCLFVESEKGFVHQILIDNIIKAKLEIRW